MKKRLTSYMTENFYPGKNTYRGNKIDHETMQNFVGKELPVTLGDYNETENKYYWTEVLITPLRLISYDKRPEWQIPNEEKAFSKKHRKLVPNRYLWEIKPL